MKAFEGYTYLDGGICAAKGFQASGTYCGIKKAMAPDSNEGEIGKEKNDIAFPPVAARCFFITRMGAPFTLFCV